MMLGRSDADVTAWAAVSQTTALLSRAWGCTTESCHHLVMQVNDKPGSIAGQPRCRLMTSPEPTPSALTHHADDGLICGYRFEPDGGVHSVASTTEAHSLLSQQGPGFVWLHMNLSHTASLRWLRAHAGLSENFFEALVDGSRSSRIERDEDALFAVLNDVTFDFSFDAKEVETLWASVTRGLVVTARRRPLRSVDRLRTAVRRGAAMTSSVDLLDHLLRDQADELQRILRRASERLDEVEDELLAGRHERHGAELAGLRRLMVRLQRLLTPEPSALTRVLGRPPGWMSADDLQQLAQANEEFSLVLRDIAALQDRVKLMQEESATKVAEENNRSLFMLTMVTVLALPINLTSGLFGMNVGGIPFAQTPAGFWWMVGLITAFTGLIAWQVMRRLRDRGR
jgi:zinc transporter